MEKVNQRLIKTVQTIENAGIPYAVIGGFAVRAWVAQVDEAAVRTTRDVDILVRKEDLPALVAAMTKVGFHHRQTTGLDMFVEHPDASARDAVRVLICGRVEKSGDPNPDVEPSTETTDFRTVPLRALVAMKLNAFRDKDRVHLRDMISLDMIDRSWLEYYPERLRLRLQELLDDPDGQPERAALRSPILRVGTCNHVLNWISFLWSWHVVTALSFVRHEEFDCAKKTKLKLHAEAPTYQKLNGCPELRVFHWSTEPVYAKAIGAVGGRT